MNTIFDKTLWFLYFKNRLITTLGLIVGLFIPILGLVIIGSSYYSAKNRAAIDQNALRKDDKLFMMVSFVLLAVTTVLTIILNLQAIQEGDSSSSIAELILGLI